MSALATWLKAAKLKRQRATEQAIKDGKPKPSAGLEGVVVDLVDMCFLPARFVGGVALSIMRGVGLSRKKGAAGGAAKKASGGKDLLGRSKGVVYKVRRGGAPTASSDVEQGRAHPHHHDATPRHAASHIAPAPLRVTWPF